MKTISKKQFDNAVQKVLNGGKSSMILTKELYPFGWTRSKGHHNLIGKVPENSKFLKNTGRGGVASDLYLVCYMAPGYKIERTKKEEEEYLKMLAKKEEQRKADAKAKRAKKKAKFEADAKIYGLTPKEYKSKLAELKAINEAIYNEYLAKKQALLDTFDGKDQIFRISTRVRFSRLLAESGVEFNPKNINDIL
jgi:hypothetical protein